MAWLSVNNDLWDGEVEVITDERPERCFYAGQKEKFFWMAENAVLLPKGTIKLILGFDISSQDEPIEI